LLGFYEKIVNLLRLLWELSQLNQVTRKLSFGFLSTSDTSGTDIHIRTFKAIKTYLVSSRIEIFSSLTPCPTFHALDGGKYHTIFFAYCSSIIIQLDCGMSKTNLTPNNFSKLLHRNQSKQGSLLSLLMPDPKAVEDLQSCHAFLSLPLS
jgi:hypothetical protein